MITIGYSTRKHNPKYQEYLQKTCMYKEVQIIEKVNNGDKSLSQVYNEIIDESNNDIVVLLHDDIEFDTNRWGDKVLKGFDKNPEYGILGLAGTKYLSEIGQWWSVPQTMYGIVNHKHDNKKWTSAYSLDIKSEIEETIIVDGLFIALDKNKIKHKFDETIKGFHFYDLGFCLPNHLDKVKVGIMFNVRATHLSIGQTNEQWEHNRVNFIKKYENVLPVDITDSNNDRESFIFIHDQDLIISFEESGRYKSLKKYRYVFVGNGDISKIENKDNVIIARNYLDNLEEYPYFTAFTGWYLLWKNNFIKTKYINLFEYDIILNNYLEQMTSKLIYENVDIIGYVPIPAANFHYIENKDWVEHIFHALKKVYNLDIEKSIKNLLRIKPQLIWASTSNITFKQETFNEFMKWFEPLIPYLKDSKTSGHAFERAISFFYFIKNKKVAITNGILQHIQMDSHKTQGHQVNHDLLQ
jgi:hypothetical protein